MAGKVIKRTKIKRVILSNYFVASQDNVVEYGAREFGVSLAMKLDAEIEKRVQELSTLYEFYTENKFLPTKTKIYRNIILGKYMILYRIKPTTVEVLAIYHSSIKSLQVSKKCVALNHNKLIKVKNLLSKHQ
ncbi:MAG: type II toxin-antitoxin system RelE/ParE family toxin [Bacteroidales bacterium]|nr:type II toxin-antitoxin system RelE/ParE family toxin [Bacteroidales bacterium]